MLLFSVMAMMYALGCVALSPIAYFCADWVQLGLATTLPFILLFPYHFIIMESPRWLLSKGRVQEASEVMRKMVRFNFGRKRSIKEFSDAVQVLKCPGEEEEEVEPAATLLDLFRGPQLRRKTVLITVVFVSCAVLYTTIAYNSENLEADLYLTWALQSFVEAPAAVVDLALVNRYGRVKPLAFSSIAAGLLCLATGPAEAGGKYLVLTFAILGKFGICMTYAIIYQLAGELFPTVVRGIGIGFGSVVGDIGNISMPYIVYSAHAFKQLPMVIMGLVGILGGAAGLFLPETLNAHLPQSLEDGETKSQVTLATFMSHFRRRKQTLLTDTEKNACV